MSPDEREAALREIVVFIDGHTKAGGILEFAGELAEEHGARLIGVFLQPEPTITPAETFVRGKGMQSLIEEHRAQLERIDADYRDLFGDIVRRHGLPPDSEWRSLPYFSGEVGAHAYYADVVVVAQPRPDGRTDRLPGLAESLILTSGRPIIMFPSVSTVSRIRRILVGWNARRESIRAVADAMPALMKAEAVEVLVIDHERTAGHGEDPGAEVARHLARRGVKMDTRHLSSARKTRGGSPSSLASCHFRCRSTCYGRLRPLPAKGLDVRSRHADGPAGGGSAGPDVPMSIEAVSGAKTTSSSANRLVAEEDASLVAAAKARDIRAFELLIERNERKIFSMAHRITRNREDAEDVVQQSFQKAFINLQKFEGDSLFSTWLTRIAINEARMLLRRKRGSREVPIEESSMKAESVLPLEVPDSAPNPEDSCLDREQEQVLSAALNKLRPGIRKAIELRDLGELSTGETALVMGLSVAAVKGRVFHGRRKLRETLSQSPKASK